MINTKALAIKLPSEGLQSYLQYVQQIPLLTAEEEQTFAKQLQENNDLSAARKLILSHLRYVVRVAKGYNGYGLPLSDLIQEGNIGLMKAVSRFNPAVGVRLVTFAMHWIKAEIHEFILRNWRIVKIATTKAQRKLFFNLRHYKKNLTWMNQDEVEAVAKDLKVKPETVREMELRLSHQDVHFDLTEEDEAESTAPVAYLEDHRYNPETQYEAQNFLEAAHDKVHYAIAKLDARSQDIIQCRWLNENKSTLENLAERYSVSAERVRQLEAQALKKLKEAIAE